jgi:crotonobetainyl-CoA:carnitine CoA-transferase CaiB-like acyl-CoA transferase
MSDSLAGIRVLDLGQYVAGPLAAMMLADQGAEVVRIEPPGGPRWATTLNDVLLRGRARHLTVDLATEAGREQAGRLAAESDVLVENFRPGVLRRLGLDPDELLARHPRLVVCSMPGFGSDDPRASLPGWEGVVLAATGCYATASEEMLAGEWWPSEGPAFTPLLLGSVFAGILGAVGITAALVARERDGHGQMVEVPLHDALFEAIGARVLRYERNTPPAALLGSGFYRCADGGYVSLITVWYRHLEWFLQAAGRGSWLSDGTAAYEALRDDDRTRRELSRRMVDLFATRSASEWEQLGQSVGVPLAAVRTAAQWRAQAPVLAPDSVRVEPAGVRPAPLVRVHDRGPLVSGGTATPPGDGALSGIHVVDMTRVLAAPTVARLLAELGAAVTKVDVAPGTTRAGLREPFFHEAVNRGKRMQVVDVHAPDGRARVAELSAAADVLVTNFTQPALRRLGVDLDTMANTAPHLVHAYVNAFGTSGPWADLRGYAEIANTVTGITARTLGDGPPSGVAPNVDLPRAPSTDYAAGIIGAFAVLVGLLRRERSGRASSVETSLVDAACLEQVAQLYGADEPADVTGMLGWTDLQRLYEVRDGWVFLGVDERRRGQLAEQLGAATADGPGFAAALADLCSEEAARLVAAVGGAAHPLVAMDDLLEPDGPADRRGLRLEQQSPVFGAVVQPGPVIRLSRTPMRPGDLPEPVGLTHLQEAVP